jgi:uncharacterized protein YndB with AHSA1/START domain
MNIEELENITISVVVQAPIEHIWTCFTEPRHIINWHVASGDWYCPSANNDFKAGGRFSYRMEANDGSVGFDFSGMYDEVKTHELIRYTLDDNRKVEVSFSEKANNQIKLIEVFEAEDTNFLELQEFGWQNMLNRFKEYVEHSI